MDPNKRALLLLLLPVLATVACGSSGGEEGGAPPGDGGGNPPAAVFPGAPGLTLTQGTFWEFRSRRFEASASASGTSLHQRIAHLRLQLGAPTRIGGVDAFPVQATVDRPDVEAAIIPRWRFLAANDHQLLGSEDGASLQVLFDGKTGQWAGPAGFWAAFPGGGIVGAVPATADGEVVHAASLEVFAGRDQDFCHVVAGQVICDSSTASSAARAEHFLKGVGPLAYFDSNRVDTGGGVATSETDIELTATSLAPNTPFLRASERWERVADLPVAVVQPRVVGYADKLWVLGGTSGGQRAKAVRIFDPGAGSWSSGPDLPTASGTMAAAVVTQGTPTRGLIPNTALWVVIDRDVYYYAPASGHWVKDSDGAAPAWRSGADLQATPVGHYLFVFPTNPSPLTSQETYAYDTRDGQWYVGNSWAPFSRAACSTLVYDGVADRVYAVTDTTLLTYDAPLGAGTISHLPGPEHAGSCNGATLVGDSLVVAGGTMASGAWDGTAILDLAEGAWHEGPTLHVPRSRPGAGALAGKVYVVGGTRDGEESAAVEVLVP